MPLFYQISAKNYLNKPGAKALLTTTNANSKNKGKKLIGNGLIIVVHQI